MTDEWVILGKVRIESGKLVVADAESWSDDARVVVEPIHIADGLYHVMGRYAWLPSGPTVPGGDFVAEIRIQFIDDSGEDSE